ncbi:THUMP domain-containing protein [Thermococcus thioreducens]|uniref:RNA-binding protein n=1 Tax=Thermococcus thioreducens TaxID=277988 RepID=A0A0Q2QNH9_9EURY|nr:THUMP domain-containing protein [Thermococcus thioreducens]ASJ13446.1 RNA-binding protein [Thermococcus thioreducens]KQH81429.1 RNA-binding protein [Thermococcus thioreducens]SEV97182.1 tRNA acetyltransferase TAN1 [Thermococcus thioreducens]
MTILLVTAPYNREGDAILELEWALERVRVKGTDWRGVLLAETPLSKGEALKKLKNFETQAIQRVVPLDIIVPASRDDIERAVLQLAKKMDGTFAVRAKVRGNRNLSARELEVKLGSLIVEAFGLKVNLSDPDYTVVVEVLGKRAGIGLVGRGELLRPEVME